MVYCVFLLSQMFDSEAGMEISRLKLYLKAMSRGRHGTMLTIETTKN